jgi:hypothetical protein
MRSWSVWVIPTVCSTERKGFADAFL